MLKTCPTKFSGGTDEEPSMPSRLMMAERRLQPEWMDQPDLDPTVHRHALAALKRLNWLSGSARLVWPEVLRASRATGGDRLTLLDVACGGGDVALALVRRAARAGIQLRLTGVDMSSVALEVAQRQAAGYGLDADWQRVDVLSDPLQACDVVHCSLFLHHLERRQAVRLLERMKQSARRVLIVQDLRRSPSAWLAAYAMCRLTTRNPVVRQDGPISVAGAFTRDELHDMADEAGLADAQIVRRWPFRMLLVWRRTA